MKTLITGATGFIGRHLVARLSSDPNYEVVTVSRSERDEEEACRTVVFDGIDSGRLAEIVLRERPDAIVHLAAAGVNPRDRDPARLTDVNAGWPAVLVRAAANAGTRAVVVAGSSAEYAAVRSGERVAEDGALESRQLYGATKAAGGLVAVASGDTLGVQVAVLRLFNVFGAGESPHRLLPSIVSSVLEGKPVPLSAGTQTRDFIEVDDACLAIESALEGLQEGRVPSGHYNVCSGIDTTVASFACGVVDAMGADADLLRFGALPMRPDDRAWLVGDPTRFLQATGWHARPLRDALDHAVSQLVGRHRPVPCAMQSTDPTRTGKTPNSTYP